MELEVIHDWILSLSEDYNVNPYIFAGIYVGAIPFFTASVAWIVRNKRRNRPLYLPVLATGLCLSSAYIYLFIAGENVPLWVYAIIVALIGYGVYSTMRKVKSNQNERKSNEV
ncbi:MAG: hypothetical protein ACOC4S_00870 [Balneolaceae bacterium]